MIGQNLYWGSVYTIDSEECFSEGANVLVGNITKGGWALTHALACLKSKYKKTTNMKIDEGNFFVSMGIFRDIARDPRRYC